jgi:hypothetical protein
MTDSDCHDCDCYVSEHPQKSGYCYETSQCVSDIDKCPLDQEYEKEKGV